MNYRELKKLVDKDIFKNIYICNFFTCRIEKMEKKISLVKNILGEYVVTLWLDYEYGRFSEQQSFKDKDLTANYAWQLFENFFKKNFNMTLFL